MNLKYKKYIANLGFLILSICSMIIALNSMDNTNDSSELFKMSFDYIVDDYQILKQRMQQLNRSIKIKHTANKLRYIRNKSDLSLLELFINASGQVAKRRVYLVAINSASKEECLNCYNSSNGWTALHYTASANSLKCCKYLINLGCDITAKDKEGKFPHEIAKGDVTRKYLVKQFKKAIEKKNVA